MSVPVSGNIKRRSFTLIARELFVFGKTNVLAFQKRLGNRALLFFFCSPRTLVYKRVYFWLCRCRRIHVRHGGGGVYNLKNITADSIGRLALSCLAILRFKLQAY